MKVKTSLDKVYGELSLLRRLVHRNCCKAHAIFDEDEDFGKLYVVMEYAERGAVMEWDSERCTYSAPSSGGTLAEATCASHVADVAAGLVYLHGIRIAHRDIKPQNLLVTFDMRLLIADFGVAAEMDSSFVVRGTDGTYAFYSPEMCGSDYAGHDGRKADVWALGISLWAFLFGTVPFYNTDIVQLLDAIAEGKLPPLPPLPVAGSDEVAAGASAQPSAACRACLLSMLVDDANARPLAEAVLEHPWCRSGSSLARPSAAADAMAASDTS
eukprot:TRINITY_DN20478_c0_g1_i1.p1 TRINITY_DN20478_c0_g1~~TRINITY_DN20478_c0_g1_i1.p1  ORF type:complete len:270 (+),score=58.85 TRINITY_DN20478_c0_g1_i1:264-1073(+)